MTYRIGDVLVPNEGSSFGITYKELKLVARHEAKGGAMWWVECTFPSQSNSAMNTFYEETFASFHKKATFFRMGYTYVFKNHGGRPTRHTVEDIYSVEEPESPHDKVTAVMRAVTPDGKEYITLGTQSDFNRMVEQA